MKRPALFAATVGVVCAMWWWMRPEDALPAPRVAAHALAIKAARPDMDGEELLRRAAAADELVAGRSRADVQAAINDMLSEPVSDDDARAWYETHRDIFGQRTFHQSRFTVQKIVARERALARLRAGDLPDR